MVNHTIHTCEQRVRFPLSAIVILFTTILPLFSILHHTYTNLPISIHQTQTKNHITISLYNISVSILHTHSYKNQNYIFIFSYHTHYYFLPNIYILSYLLLITTTTIYIPTYNQNTPLSQIDRYISYIHNYYLLTYTENRTHLSIHLFHPTIV